jgi:RNA polymerase sigma factor (sigma-70 family)
MPLPASLPDPSARRDRFATIYESNYHRVLGYALRRASDEDAADVVAETFLVAWRRLDELPEGDGARLWLYGTARRVLANQQRGRRRRDRLSERIRAEHPQEVSSALPVSDLNRAADALSRLRPEDREILALVAWEELHAGEVAQVLGCSRNAARIRLHRARRRFARELDRAFLKRNSAPGHVSGAYE